MIAVMQRAVQESQNFDKFYCRPLQEGDASYNLLIMDIAIIGIGGMGRSVIQHLLEADCASRLIACDRNGDAFGDPRFSELSKDARVVSTTNLSDVLDDPSVGLAFITTTNAAHAPLATACLEAGMAVMCEKPIATTIDDARQLVELADRTNGFLQIGFELRYSTLYSTVKNWIDAGLLGEVRNTHCTYTCSARERGEWRDDPDLGGSMFGEKLSHYVDLPRWWIGSPVTEVYSICSPNTTPDMGVRDNYHTSYRFESGAVSHLSFQLGMAAAFDGDPLQNAVSQQLDDGHELRFLVVGDRGAAATDVFRRTIRRWAFEPGETKMISRLVEQDTWEADDDHRYFHNTRDQTLDVVRRVREGLPPSLAPADALQTMELCFAAEQSADTQRPTFLDPHASTLNVF